MRQLTLLTMMIAALWMSCSESDPYEQAYNDNFELPKMAINVPQARGTDVDVAPLDKGIESFKTGEFELALKGFNSYLEKNPEYFQVKFYRGLTLMKLDDHAKAVEDFKEVASFESEYREQAEWYLALSLIKQRKRDEAIVLLEEMEANNATQGKRAAMLLKKINEWPS